MLFGIGIYETPQHTLIGDSFLFCLLLEEIIAIIG